MLLLQGAKRSLNTTTRIKNKVGFHGKAINGDARKLCEQRRSKEALDILHILDYRGIWQGESTYASLSQEFMNKKALPVGKQVFNQMIDRGYDSDIFSGNKFVIMYAKSGSLADARRVLDEMPNPNVVSWTVLIAAYARHGYHEEALALFYQMQRTGVQPNQFTFASVLPACGNLEALEQGKNVHEDVIICGFHCDTFVANALIDMYAKCGEIEDACKVFEKMLERNVVSCTTMIAAYVRHGHNKLALALFYQMQREGIQPNQFTFASVLPACANLAALEDGKRAHEDIINCGFQSNVFVGNALVDMYAKCARIEDARQVFDRMPEWDVVSLTSMIAGYAQNGCVEEALKLFEKMPERDAVSWNMMIGVYAQNGHFNEALKLFGQMQLIGVKSDSITFISVLPACANLAVLNHGKEVHENIIRQGFQYEVFVGSVLVDMYAKCGSIKDACRVFDKMPERDGVLWTAMIVGYAMHGCGKEALKLFEQMQHTGTEPDHVTFVGVLSACCHAGLVDDGWQYFDCMIRDYHITPTVEHYCCMVDLLGRAGLLEEAEDFVNKMPIKPNAAVWGSLLGACRIHTNIELGERVAEHLFELEPKNAANYVLLSSIYATAGKWEDVEKMQKMRKNRRTRKSPGCSWIEVNNKVYSFVVRDKSHPLTHKIYEELERLYGQIKKAGYVLDMNLVLTDVEEEHK